MTFDISDYLIPMNKGHAVGRGWLNAVDNEPKGVTWHWTGMGMLADERKVLGGNGTKKSRVSSHYCVGRSFSEGIDRYVTLENRSWHAGIEQKLRWDGKRSNNDTKGARATIGIETTHVGYARDGHPAGHDWTEAYSPNGHAMKIQPWTDEQFAMMVHVGKEIIERWSHIPWQYHHGHHDICPGYKVDVAAFPFADLLREIYDDDGIPDVWTALWSVKSRQRILIALGYDLGPWQDDGDWGSQSVRALMKFQEDQGSALLPFWTTFTNVDAWHACERRGLDFETIAATSL